MKSSQTLSSIRWVAMLRYATRSVDFIKLIILARILSPADFGLFSLAAVTVNVLESLSDTGFSYAFIHHQGDINKYAKTLFIINAGRGIALSLVSLLLSFVITFFFSQPSLLPLLLLISFTPAIKGFSNPAIITFQKDMNFKSEFFLKLIPSVSIGLSSILFGVILKNPLALVLGVIIGAFAEVVFSYVFCKTHFKEPFSKKRFKKLFAFGRSMTIGGVFSFLMTQIDNVIIGKIFGPAALGQYDVLFKLGSVSFSEITDVVSRVTFPLFSKVKKNKNELKRLFIKNVVLITLPALLFTFVIALFPKQIILLLLGSQWVTATVLLQILAFYGLLRAIIGPVGPLFLAIGKPVILSKANIINFIAILCFIFPLAKLYGLNGVAVAMLLSYVISVSYLCYFLYQFFISPDKRLYKISK